MDGGATDAYSVLTSLSKKIKKVALNMSDIELKVEEATDNKPWGPHGTLMSEIAKAAYDWDQYRQIMGVIGRRLQATGEEWRHVYKSLILLDYLLKHGPTRIIQELDSSLTVIERFHTFKYVDESGKDCGINVRHRSKELSTLVRDRQRVEAEREKARALKAKYSGMSREEASHGLGSLKSSRTFEEYDRGIERASEAHGNSGGLMGSGALEMEKTQERRGGGATGARKQPSRYSDGYDDGGYDPWPDRSRNLKDERTATPTEEVDEFEALSATRNRIEKLKSKGYLSDMEQDLSAADATNETENKARNSTPSRPAAKLTSGPAKAKRLSDMKVNPKIAASLSGMASTAQAAGSLDVSFSAQAQRTVASTSQSVGTEGPSMVNLLGDLEEANPTQTAETQATPAVQTAQPDTLLFDAFTTTVSADVAVDGHSADDKASNNVWDSFISDRANSQSNTGHGENSAAQPTASLVDLVAAAPSAADDFDAFVTAASTAGPHTTAKPATAQPDFMGLAASSSSVVAPQLGTSMSTTSVLDSGVSLPTMHNAPLLSLAVPTAVGSHAAGFAPSSDNLIHMAVPLPVGLNVPSGSLPVGASPYQLPPGAQLLTSATPISQAGWGSGCLAGPPSAIPSMQMPFASSSLMAKHTVSTSSVSAESPMRAGHYRTPSTSKKTDPFADLLQ